MNQDHLIDISQWWADLMSFSDYLTFEDGFLLFCYILYQFFSSVFEIIEHFLQNYDQVSNVKWLIAKLKKAYLVFKLMIKVLFFKLIKNSIKNCPFRPQSVYLNQFFRKLIFRRISFNNNIFMRSLELF